MKIFILKESTGDSGVEVICKEAQNMLKLEHHRIVPLYGIGHTVDKREIHIVMPLYPYGCLKKYIANHYHEIKVCLACLY